MKKGPHPVRVFEHAHRIPGRGRTELMYGDVTSDRIGEVDRGRGDVHGVPPRRELTDEAVGVQAVTVRAVVGEQR